MQRHLFFVTALAAAFLTFSNAHAQNSSPYWSLAGNSNASTSSKLGTTTTDPLRLITNNTTRLFISQSAGQVGIGTTAPKSKLAVFNGTSQPATAWVSSAGKPAYTGFGESTSGTGDHIFAMASNTATVRPVLIGRRSRGTLSLPTAVSLNDNLSTVLASGYDGSAFQNSAAMEFTVDGTPAAGKVPTSISFYTGSNTATRAERLRITNTGSIGIGTTTPKTTYKLDVRGATNGIYVESTPIDGNKFGPGIGLYAKGDTGVRSSGIVGISGFGESNTPDETRNVIGVYGQGEDIGVMGSATGSGVIGTSRTYGLNGYGDLAGGICLGKRYGLVAQMAGNESGGAGVYGSFQGGSHSEGYGGDFDSDNGAGLHARGGGVSNATAAVFDGNIYAVGVFETSDGSLKQNVSAFDGALAIIDKLKPRNYQFKADEKLALLRLPAGTHYGLIAQDVEAVLPQLVKEVSHSLSAPELPDPTTFHLGKGRNASVQKSEQQPAKQETLKNIKAVNYTELIPIIIKGMQELGEKNKEIDGLKEQVANQQQQIAELRQMLLDLKNGTAGTLSYSGAHLEQSTPNPASSTSTIRYQVPASAASAKLVVTNAKGQVVKELTLANRSAGQVSINTTALAAGTYNYTLFVDGKLADSKRLVIAR